MIVLSGCIRKLVLKMVNVSSSDVNLFVVGKKICEMLVV